MASCAQLPVRKKGQMKCSVHRNNDVIFVCNKCNVLICSTCTLSSHKPHLDSFSELSKIKNEQQNIITDFINDTENVKIPKLNQEIISYRTKISSCKSQYENLRKNVIENNNQCKLELDKITADYISICDKMEVAATDLMQTHIKELERRLETLKELSSEYKQVLQTGTDVFVYDSVSEIREMDPDTPATPNIDMTEFTPGMDRQSHLKQAIGNIKLPTDHLRARSVSVGHSESSVVRPKLSTETGQVSTGTVRYKLRDCPKVIYQFPYSDNITSICPTSDGFAWLCNYRTDTLKFINNNGQVIQTIHHNSNITGISLDPTTGRLWFCCCDEQTICEVSTSSTPVKRFATNSRPHSLCVTREGRVVVGTDGIRGYKVVMFRMDGLVLHRDIVEESGKWAVWSITECGVTGNIAVVSCKNISRDDSNPNCYRRHVIVYNPTLQPVYYYRGNPDPRTVVYDSKGNIVIADYIRNTIELISGAGKYIKTLHTNEGRQGPVGIQKGDVLWSCLELDTGDLGLELLRYYSN